MHYLFIFYNAHKGQLAFDRLHKIDKNGVYLIDLSWKYKMLFCLTFHEEKMYNALCIKLMEV